MLERYNEQIYGVWDDAWEDRCARLLPLEAVIAYEGDEQAADELAIAIPYRQIEQINSVEADAETFPHSVAHSRFSG